MAPTRRKAQVEENITPCSVAAAPYKRLLTTESGHTFWLISQRPFAEAATDMFRDAIRVLASTPSVMSRVK